ncbi:carboxylesterase family protein [Micromonospora sonneratiae]|uniref:Carboxylic ester hydrolase n=1 Tax=Micromonospora sonneratiae TaxID=1184706 RepID=A0ABW3YJD0_9ACTN
MRILTTIVTVAALLAMPAPASAKPAEPGKVRTDAGWISGTVRGDHRLYQGIPYAAAPVGELRWRSPQPVEPWTGIRDATRPGNRCAQTADSWGLPASDSEDCLYLNVTAPRGASPRHPRPVLVWLHGGSLTKGAGSDYDATRLATRGDIVVVTVNYRLGIFGFFGHPGLSNGGAFGVEDQQAALRWVRRNAAAFGGDPGNVTLAGESAGSHSVCAQLASPASAGLFHRAITQSSPCWSQDDLPKVLGVPLWVPASAHEEYGQMIAGQLSCSDVSCLRGRSVLELLAQPPLPLPGYGNAVLPEDPAKVFAEGRFHRVPILSGITRDEGTMFASMVFPKLTAAQYVDGVTQIFGDRASAVLAAYPPGEVPTQTAAAIMSDLDWARQARDTDRLLARHVPVYSYEFLDRTAPQLFPFPDDQVEPMASHGSELPFLFDPSWESAPLTNKQRRLGDLMIGYWARFAATGDPNGHGLPAWRHHPYVQGLDLDRVGRFDRTAAHRLNFWDGI